MEEVVLDTGFLPDIEAKRFVFARQKPTDIILSFHYETYEIICKNAKTGKVDLTVSLLEGREIRTGKQGKYFKLRRSSSLRLTKKIESAFCFVVVYGMDFRLKMLPIATSTKKDAECWVKGLQYLLSEKPTNYLKLLDIWRHKQYELAKATPSSNHNCISLQIMKEFTNRISCKISTRELKSILEESGGVCSMSDFERLATEFLHDQQIFTECFGDQQNPWRLSISQFKMFLREKQQEQNSIQKYMKYFRSYEKSSVKKSPYMTCYEAVNYLFSKDNQVWNTKYDAIQHDDMSRPLSHYWIKSSHNTYLMGGQFSSESSVEAYARCLLQGTRCVELDCWDGPDGSPVIYHGRSLTTKVGFVDVLKTIRDYAFVKSEYPVILSIENHCSPSQQKIMAKKFQEIFGNKLVTKPLFQHEKQLPSPYELRNCILLKCRKQSLKSNTSVEEGSCEKESIISTHEILKSGKMYLQEAGKWEPFLFALTKEAIIYTEIETNGNESVDLDTPCEATTLEELHHSKRWYHGAISGGNEVAAKRVRDFGVEGGFLVRESELDPSGYTLSFLSDGIVLHLSIKSNETKTQFYIVASEKFDSLYSLVSHYRCHSLDTPNFRIKPFTRSVPSPEPNPEQFSWFYPNINHPEPMSRQSAEEILKKIPLSGAFLVRYSQDYLNGRGNRNSSRFVITFRMDNRIRHCRVKEDGRLLYVTRSQRFETIDQLIDNYSTKRAFYNGSKLKYAVNRELYRFAHNTQIQNPEAHKVYLSTDYIYDHSISARAVYAFHPDEANLLRFKRGDIIKNIVKQDALWWKGDLDDQLQKHFPANFVEEIDQSNSPFGSLQKGSIPLGKVDIEKGKKDEICEHVIKIYSAGSPVPARIGVETEKEARDWQEMIESVSERHLTRKSSSWFGSVSITNCHKIAPELSNQVVYCCTVPKESLDKVICDMDRVYNQMVSLSETQAESKIATDPYFLVWLHEVQLSRVYPKAQRINSFNFNPIRFWNHGFQLVALNCQTPDKPCQLNHGRFRSNGQCGYVIKPEFLFREDFDPGRIMDLHFHKIRPMNLNIQVLGARHLARADNKSIYSPLVEIEIFGADFDCQKYLTQKDIVDNGLNPYWNEHFAIKILNPELALIHFSVFDQDSFGDSHLVGQAAYPVKCLRQGYRSVVLENGFGEELLARLLIRLEYSVLQPTSDVKTNHYFEEANDN